MEMALTRYLVPYAGTALILVALDLLWLGLAMRGFYKAALAPIMREQPLIGPAILFYAVYAVGLVWFAVLPGIETGQWWRALLSGAAFGFFAYVTYDMTNYATLRDFPLRVVLVDVAWGLVVSALAAATGWWAVELTGR